MRERSERDDATVAVRDQVQSFRMERVEPSIEERRVVLERIARRSIGPAGGRVSVLTEPPGEEAHYVARHPQPVQQHDRLRDARALHGTE